LRERRRPMAKVYAGLDMGSSGFHQVAMDKERVVLKDRKFDTTEHNLIAAFEDIKGEVHVHLEAGELAAWVRRVLRKRVTRVVVGHPKSSAWIAKDPLKRDRLDAFKLADLLRTDQVHEVYYSDDDQRTLFKQIVQHYDDVTSQEIRLKNKIKAAFREQGVIVKGTDVYTAAGRDKYLTAVPFAAAREAITQLYELLDVTLKAQKSAMKLMKRESEKYPEIARFDGAPGCGVVSSCRFSAYVQTPYRFSAKRKLWRYSRLGITDRQSDGKPLGRQSLDRNGSGRLKEVSRTVFLGAMQTAKDNLFKRSYRGTLQRTHNKTHARLTTQRKILAVLLAMWKGGTEFNDKIDKG
jgi:transposase